MTYTVPTGGAGVSKIVLMRPGSVTHGLDTEQRYLELQISDLQEPAPGVIYVKMPANRPGTGTTLTNPHEVSAPPGYYMLFAVTSTGVPSVAKWVRLV